MKKDFFKYSFYFFIILGVLCSSYVISQRILSERQQNSFDIAISYQDICYYKDDSFIDVLSKYNFQDYIDNIVIRPSKVIDLERSGEIILAQGDEIKRNLKIQSILTPYILEIINMKGIDSDSTYVFTDSDRAINMLEDVIDYYRPDATFNISEKKYGFRSRSKTYKIVQIDVSIDEIRQMYTGIDDEKVSSVILNNTLTLDLRDVATDDSIFILKRSKILPRYVISDRFSKEMNDFLTLNMIKKLYFEFEKKNVPYPYIRAHTLHKKDIYKEDDIVDRFKRAFTERKVGFFWYQFDPNLSRDENLKKAKEITSVLSQRGLKNKEPEIFFLKKIKDYDVLTWIISISLVLFLITSLEGLLGFGYPFIFSISIPFSILILIFVPFYVIKLFLAFSASIIIPLNSLNMLKLKNGHGFVGTLKTIIENITVLFSYVMTGIIFTVALFYSEDFLMGQRLFRGVKLSFVLPVIIFIIYNYSISGSRFNVLFQKELKIKHLIYFLGFSCLMFYYIIRTSNEGAMYMLPYEREIRRFLERVFEVRPRTKEFLLLYPAIFIISSRSIIRKKNLGYYITLLFILIGQGCIFNTFMHFHIPFSISLMRTFNGLILGLFTGTILLTTLYGINKIDIFRRLIIKIRSDL